MSNFEVELRGQLSHQDFNRVKTFLDANSNGVKDNKLTYFFVTQKIILKVTDEISKDKAKITIKVGDETENILEEYEINIPRKSIPNAVKLFKTLGYSKINRVEQKRINYKYKGSHISLKHTPDWGLHFEVETKAKNKEEAAEKKLELFKICKELGIFPMTPKEIKNKIKQINKSHNFT